uniref:Uncharacterized protein n=1 Tax=Triticum urartu TaxID=4572 RepID=A0A8R7R5P0_TRIUA
MKLTRRREGEGSICLDPCTPSIAGNLIAKDVALDEWHTGSQAHHIISQQLS